MRRGMHSAFKTFTCPNCNALYQVVKVESPQWDQVSKND
jgi:transcription elongation factor Elf1